MRYLSAEELLAINQHLCQELRQFYGVIAMDRVQQVVEKPQLSIDGYEPFPSLWAKAAAMMNTLMEIRPFAHANVSTGFVAAEVMLRLNGYALPVASTDLDKIRSVALHQLTVPQIAAWLEQNAQPWVHS